jgi:hypothetical protein
VKAVLCCMLTDSENWQYVFMNILVLKSYSVYESAGMTEPHEKLLGIRRVSNPSTSIDPSSLKIGFLVLIQNVGLVRDNGIN